MGSEMNKLSAQLTAILIGNSDGMGLAATQRLLAAGWNITGVSRSDSPIKDATYRHHVADVSDATYVELMNDLVRTKSYDLCIYFAGIGELLDPLDMRAVA